MEERGAVDLAELEGEPTWRADVLFDRALVRPRPIARWTAPVGVSLLAVVVGMTVQRVLRRP